MPCPFDSNVGTPLSLFASKQSLLIHLLCAAAVASCRCQAPSGSPANAPAHDLSSTAGESSSSGRSSSRQQEDQKLDADDAGSRDSTTSMMSSSSGSSSSESSPSAGSTGISEWNGAQVG